MQATLRRILRMQPHLHFHRQPLLVTVELIRRRMYMTQRVGVCQGVTVLLDTMVLVRLRPKYILGITL
jgi:hypothetical protein